MAFQNSLEKTDGLVVGTMNNETVFFLPGIIFHKKVFGIFQIISAF